MDKIDLRSDTVTWPTEHMRAAMASAPVGDDVYGEDPTINRLEAMAADMLGKEAAVFVTSGTMGNVASLLAWAGRGDEIITGDKSHIFMSEAGNPATLGGIATRTIPVQLDGTLRLEDIEAAIRPDNEHYPRTKVVCLENTQGGTGGQPLSVGYIDAVGELVHRHGLKLHIDGARIFNGAVAVGEDVKRVVQAADSVSFCLSKGLCAPVGSVVVGPSDFMVEARRARKAMGGSLRQAGIIAAAGIVALEEMIDRLADDHATACQLAEGLATIPAIEVDPTRTTSNFVMWSLTPDAPLTPEQLIEALAEDDIVIRMPRGGEFRFVTHYWITPERVEFVVDRMRSYLGS